MLIPHTLAVTTLGTRKVGEPVNIEVDILARYVRNALANMAIGATGGPKTVEEPLKPWKQQ
jgi:riboflavin synthase